MELNDIHFTWWRGMRCNTRNELRNIFVSSQCNLFDCLMKLTAKSVFSHIHMLQFKYVYLLRRMRFVFSCQRGVYEKFEQPAKMCATCSFHICLAKGRLPVLINDKYKIAQRLLVNTYISVYFWKKFCFFLSKKVWPLVNERRRSGRIDKLYWKCVNENYLIPFSSPFYFMNETKQNFAIWVNYISVQFSFFQS